MVTSFLKNNRLVLCLYAIALIFSFELIFRFDKPILHIYLNQFVGNPYVDMFFFYITYLGDGIVVPFILLIILIYNIRLGLYATCSVLSATIFSQLLKRVFFDDVNRPFYIFQWLYKYPLRYVDGVDKHIHNSFPSGHATQAFAVFMCLSFVTQNKYLKFIFYCLALFTAISRVYLSQHWLIDVTVGSLIGMLFSVLFYYLVIAKNRLPQLNKAIYQLKKS
jgi:membrane-associated phospholipid phosphatase